MVTRYRVERDRDENKEYRHPENTSNQVMCVVTLAKDIWVYTRKLLDTQCPPNEGDCEEDDQINR
jgi:hypothetical protein